MSDELEAAKLAALVSGHLRHVDETTVESKSAPANKLNPKSFLKTLFGVKQEQPPAGRFTEPPEDPFANITDIANIKHNTQNHSNNAGNSMNIPTPTEVKTIPIPDDLKALVAGYTDDVPSTPQTIMERLDTTPYLPISNIYQPAQSTKSTETPETPLLNMFFKEQLDRIEAKLDLLLQKSKLVPKSNKNQKKIKKIKI